jgi:Fe-S cluster assembly iron-binding protein IscA
MSLYDDASLIAYPSGYKESKIYAQKPVNGTGDLTFTRASSATRVNEQGLIETAAIIGSELVVNGDFNENVNGWVANNANATFVWQADKTALFTSTSFAYVGVSPLLNLNAAIYKVSFDVLSFNGTLASVHIGLGSSGNTITTAGSYTYFYTSIGGNTEFQIRPNGGGAGSINIDNVSVKEYTTSNIPRIDYSNGCGSLLLEPQRTNLIVDSNSNFIINNCTIDYNNATSPEGVLNAYKATATGTSNTFVRTATVSMSDPSAFSVFFKKGNNQWLQIMAAGFTGHYVNVDIENGVFGTSGSDTSDLLAEDYGNGWYRISGQFSGYSGNATLRIYMGNSSSSGWAGTTTVIGDYYYGYGFQLEQGSYATSYIPTSGTTVTRLADTSSTTGLSSVVGQTEGTMFVEMASLSNSVTSNYVSISDGSYNNRLSILFSTGTNVIRAFLRLGGSVQCDFNTTAYDITQMNKIAFKYKANDFSLWVNGTEVAIDSSGSTFSGSTLTTFAFDEIGTGTGALNGNVQNLMVFPSALTDEQLTDLTGTVQTSFNSLALSLGYTIL